MTAPKHTEGNAQGSPRRRRWKFQFLDNLKISVKILGVVGLLGLVTAALVVTGGLQQARMDAEFSELVEKAAPAQAEFARSSRRVTGMGHLAHKIIAASSDNPEDVQPLTQELDRYAELARNNLLRAKELNPANALTYDAFITDIEALYKKAKEVATLVANLETRNARFIVTDVDIELAKINDRIDEFNSQLQAQMQASREATSAQAKNALIMNYVIGFASLAVCLALAVWISLFKISRPLSRMAERMGLLANGDLNVEIEGQSRGDEVGAMAKAVQVFKDNAIALKTAEAEAEEQRRKAEEERARNEAQKEQAARQVAQVVAGLGAGLERLAHGDLTFRVTGEWTDEYRKIQQDFNEAIDKLEDTIANIVRSSEEVSSAAKEISSSTTDLSQRTEEQAASLEQTSASMEQIAATVKKNAENARHANELTQDARQVADEGGKVVAEVVSAMARIEDSSRKIGDIISVIDEIARQTNLLALNAAVEAARAGDAGRGFAVVASEVRGLAQRSSQAAKDISNLIVNSSSQVQDGVALVNKAGDSLEAILRSINSVAAIVAEIANASAEQASGIDQINVALSQMDEVTQQNSAIVEENAATAKALEQQQAAMSERVGYFRLAMSQAAEEEQQTAPQRRDLARASHGKGNGAAPRSRRPMVDGNLALRRDADLQEF